MSSASLPSRESAFTDADSFVNEYNRRLMEDMRRIREETERCAHYRRLLTEANIAEFKKEILARPAPKRHVRFYYHFPNKDLHSDFSKRLSKDPEISAAWSNRRQIFTECSVIEPSEVREILSKDPDFKAARLDVEFHYYPWSSSPRQYFFMYKGRKEA
jgi:hypothetical protein